VNYELGIAIWTNRLVWIAGPFHASEHDITIFRGGIKTTPLAERDQNALFFQIPEGKKAIGDSGYEGEAYEGGPMSISRELDDPATKSFKGRVKSRHESFNGRLKSFNVLDSAFRHGRDKHAAAFEAVCVAVQYDLENGHPLFGV
jgi:hypothetical protein